MSTMRAAVFIKNGTIALRGADNYNSLRGNGLDFVVLDEFSCVNKRVGPR